MLSHFTLHYCFEAEPAARWMQMRPVRSDALKPSGRRRGSREAGRCWAGIIRDQAEPMMLCMSMCEEDTPLEWQLVFNILEGIIMNFNKTLNVQYLSIFVFYIIFKSCLTLISLFPVLYSKCFLIGPFQWITYTSSSGWFIHESNWSRLLSSKAHWGENC